MELQGARAQHVFLRSPGYLSSTCADSDMCEGRTNPESLYRRETGIAVRITPLVQTSFTDQSIPPRGDRGEEREPAKGSMPKDQNTYVQKGIMPEVCEANLIDEGGDLYISCIAGALFVGLVKRGANLRFVFCAFMLFFCCILLTCLLSWRFMLFFRCIPSRPPAAADPIGGRDMGFLLSFRFLPSRPPAD